MDQRHERKIAQRAHVALHTQLKGRSKRGLGTARLRLARTTLGLPRRRIAQAMKGLVVLRDGWIGKKASPAPVVSSNERSETKVVGKQRDLAKEHQNQSNAH